MLGQAQDIVTIVSFAVGLAVYAPWLIVLLLIALVPVFVGELHFNAQSYAVNYQWTPERRELDYLRMVGASAQTAKEVKSFNLNDFLIDRYRVLSLSIYRANRSIALRRAGWGGLFTTIGTIGYYLAYAIIAFRTVSGDFTIGDLTFLVTEQGKPFTVNGIGNWFRDRCVEAEVPGRAHGLRKAGAMIAANSMPLPVPPSAMNRTGV